MIEDDDLYDDYIFDLAKMAQMAWLRSVAIGGNQGGGAPAVPVAPVLAWVSPSSDSTPEFDIDLTNPQAGDLVRLYRDGVQVAEHELTQPEIDAFFVSLGLSAWVNGIYAVTATMVSGGGESLPSNTETVIINVIAAASLTVFGDSITEGANATTTANRWANQLQTALGATTLVNQGISGTVLQNSNDSGGAPRTNNGRDRYASALLGANLSERTYILYGFNDLRYTGAPATFNLTNFINDYREILNGMLLAGVSRTAIYLGSPPWGVDALYSTGSTGFTGSNRTTHEAYVAAVADLAEEYGTYYADIYAYMRDNGGAALIDVDNIHPKDAGHVVIKNGWLTAALNNTASSPAISSVTSGAAGELTITWTAPASGTVTNYTVEAGSSSGVAFTSTDTLNALTKTFTGLTADSYVARLRANFSDGTSSPWVFYTTGVAVAGVSSGFFEDNFSDTNGTLLTAHTSDTGHTWAVQFGNSAPASPPAIQSGRLYTPGVPAVYRAMSGSSAPTADYDVEAVIDRLTATAGENVGIAGRMQAATNDFYFVFWAAATANWRLFKNSGGSPVQLGSAYSDTFPAGATRTIKLRMQGSSVEVFVDGVSRITATDSTVTGAGAPGIRCNGVIGSTTGTHINSIVARTL